ncbi:MAG: hypothetical protein H7068_08240 [Pedobacter sp.]|nr:hypothetical protein [Chitinophagaceae bacterium]
MNLVFFYNQEENKDCKKYDINLYNLPAHCVRDWSGKPVFAEGKEDLERKARPPQGGNALTIMALSY